MTVFGHLHMPPLGGATEWLNAEPLGPAELRGRGVVPYPDAHAVHDGAPLAAA